MEFGKSLVVRSGRTLRPTEAGWAILPQATHLLQNVRDLRSFVHEEEIAGELNRRNFKRAHGDTAYNLVRIGS